MSGESDEDSSARELVVGRSDSIEVCQYCPERPYIEVEIPQNVQRVLKVIFSMRSHDQGWCDMYNIGPPYTNSYTWFEVNAQSPDGRNYLPRIRIQYNRRANAEFHTHNILWNCADEASDVSNWLRSLRAGDTIQLIARAQLLGWVNFIEQAEIKVEYDILKPSLAIQPPPMSSRYHYFSPLSHASHEIRLLVIQPGNVDDPIACLMIHTKLKETDHEKFCALSYCWGDAADRTTIRMEYYDRVTLDFTVNRSVETALKHLRSPWSSINMWIDAVCINQNDLQERAEQVSIMSHIYSKADMVEIWLGEGDQSAHLSMRIIRDIYNFNNNICAGGLECKCQGTRHSKPRDAHVPQYPKQSLGHSYKRLRELFDLYKDEIRTLPESQFTLMTTLFGNPWFRRVWVVQEAILAQKATVHCGPESLPWEELIEVNKYLDSPDREGDLYLEPQDQIPSLWMTLIQKEQALPRPLVHTQGTHLHEPGILEVFLEGLDLRATNPRDKLYALLAFGRETNSTDVLPASIAPDYAKPLERVFADFTRWWIVEHRSLRILSAIHGQTGRQWQSTHCPTKPAPPVSRPTWTVRWEGKHSFAQATLATQFGYRASGNTVPGGALLDDASPLLLTLAGYRVSTIEEVAHLPLDREYKHLHGMLEAFDKIFDPCGTWRWWMSSKLLGETVVLNNADGVLEALSRFADHQNTHWQYLQKRKLSVLDLAAGKDDHGLYRRGETDSVPPCVDRCFFVTANGLLGLCPSRARAADIIAILFGGNVPYILRPVESEDSEGLFELVGECYVQGIMNGEFVKDQRQKGKIPKVFTLL